LLVTSNSHGWYIDSGAFIHLSHKKDWLQRFTKITPMQINLGDNTTLETIGMQDMEVTMTMGGKNIDNVFKDVLYTLKIAKNFFFGE